MWVLTVLAYTPILSNENHSAREHCVSAHCSARFRTLFYIHFARIVVVYTDVVVVVASMSVSTRRPAVDFEQVRADKELTLGQFSHRAQVIRHEAFTASSTSSSAVRTALRSFDIQGAIQYVQGVGETGIFGRQVEHLILQRAGSHTNLIHGLLGSTGHTAAGRGRRCDCQPITNLGRLGIDHANLTFQGFLLLTKPLQLLCQRHFRN
jgi:hypothetical protein